MQEKPMKELNTRKRSGNLAALLAYVIGTGWGHLRHGR
jgi:hypothetical protein